MDLCSHFGGKFDLQNERHIQELLVAISVVVANYGEILANNSARTNNGFFFVRNWGPSEFSELIFNSAWANEDRALEVLKNPFAIEKYGRSRMHI